MNNDEIKETYQKAFFDLLEERVSDKEPAYDWIVKLYLEIKMKLLKITSKNSKLAMEINNTMDLQLFEQMIRNNAFDGNDFYNLINFVFDMCLKLQSPQRDEDTNNRRNEVLDIMKNGGTYAQIMVKFIKNANICIDFIYEDIINLSREFKLAENLDKGKN